MEFTVSGKLIGHGHPVFIIAEGCDNHLGSLDVAKEMARRAALAGCDAIKFQHHIPDEEMLPDVPMSDNFDTPLYEFLLKNALSLKQHEELKDYCEKTGIIYLCTPFSWKAAQEINELGVPVFKIGSGEMTDIPTLERIAGFGKPMIVSTGMCTFEEIDRTYKALVNTGVPLALTNCVSEYPPVYEDISLGVLTKMITRYPNAVIGHSDHTPDLYTSYAAVAIGARIIEKHVIISKQTPGPDQSVSIDFFDLHQLVDGVRKTEKALGNEKFVHKKEEKIREWAFRSIVSLRDIKKGETIDGDMIWSKRPGTGIPSYQRNAVIGKKAANNIRINTLVKWEDLE
ncbi:MAG: N-acetylneuraminate synthase family protein [Nitrospirae bacterium]|nr:N-acetylneuraminate synthase family protein [Nitrospirota bacterium]